ncbi:hypothetical protein LIER_26511 [Lithospermum erythrorhizon]|uniref:Trichome birefringence-like N-terminal domain-containing protein n=1 Tax=Lithospermum erythrorhizon TaxID=34254 RepID=A0AAV3R9W4_LITER
MLHIFFLVVKLLGLILLSLTHRNKVHGKFMSNIGRCDVSEGNWIFDMHYPLYDIKQCPFVEKIFSCQNNGRPDNFYPKFRWQPKGCEISSFDGRQFLSKHRGKDIMFVGDSLSLNQWQSLTCMLHVAVPEANYTVQRNSQLSTFTFPDYNISIMLERNAFLVDLVMEGNDTRVMKLDSLTSSLRWEHMDVLIFDSWHWWLHNGRKQPWDFVEYGKTRVKDIDRLVAYEKALTTWAKWVDSSVDVAKTKVFFQGISPDHDACEGRQGPLKTAGVSPPSEVVLERILNNMSAQVYLLNINRMSQYRADGHPSFYGLGGHNGDDCTHWCLPGVPDTWNLILLSFLV